LLVEIRIAIQGKPNFDWLTRVNMEKRLQLSHSKIPYTKKV
jgi:hypothetical protein